MTDTPPAEPTMSLDEAIAIIENPDGHTPEEIQAAEVATIMQTDNRPTEADGDQPDQPGDA